jgi:hypothetical protein
MIGYARKNSWSGLLTFPGRARRGPTAASRINLAIEQSGSVLENTNWQNRDSLREEKETNVLWTIFVVLLILWLLGFSLHIAGGLIHLLLVVALVVLVLNLVGGRRSSV